MVRLKMKTMITKIYNFQSKIRGLIYGIFLKKVGKNFLVFKGAMIYGFNNTIIGNDVAISNSSYINGRGGLVIGDNVLFGPFVSIITENHNFLNPHMPISYQGVSTNKVKIGSGTWLGIHCIILPGVNIGKNCVIGAGSIVTKDIPDYSIVVGNPARVIKKIERLIN